MSQRTRTVLTASGWADIIVGVLLASNIDPEAGNDVPLWVVLACHAAIGLGTLSGGWRIVRTMGSRITKLKPGSRVELVLHKAGFSDERVTVTVPGGDLQLEWRETDDHVLMTGPVAFEFEGRFDPALFAAVA